MSLNRVVSQNIQELRDSKKRKEIFHYFNIKKFDIIMLQKTHSNAEVERVWRVEWGNSKQIMTGPEGNRQIYLP